MQTRLRDRINVIRMRANIINRIVHCVLIDKYRRVLTMIIFLIGYTTEEIHPSKPMITSTAAVHNTETFDVDKSKALCTFAPTTYKVLKEKLIGRKTYNFFAVNNLHHKVDRRDSMYRRYHKQIGYATCLHGWIDMVSVVPYAQNCGIATVLTELCLIDPNINKNIQGNRAVKEIFRRNIEETFSLESRTDDKMVRDVANHLRDHCSHLVGLEMKAKPLKGAYAYFSAAKRMGYQYMVVQFYDHARKRRSNPNSETPCGQKFKYYEVEVAQGLFDPNTGNIEDPIEDIDPEGSTSGSGDRAKWYFCRQLIRIKNFV